MLPRAAKRTHSDANYPLLCDARSTKFPRMPAIMGRNRHTMLSGPPHPSTRLTCPCHGPSRGPCRPRRGRPGRACAPPAARPPPRQCPAPAQGSAGIVEEITAQRIKRQPALRRAQPQVADISSFRCTKCRFRRLDLLATCPSGGTSSAHLVTQHCPSSPPAPPAAPPPPIQ